MTQQTKWLALCALVALWIGQLYVYVIDVPPPIEVPLKYQSGQTVANSQRTSAVETWEVQSLRAQARELPVTPKRNIFMVASIARSSDPAARPRTQQKKQPLNAVPPVPPTPLAPPPPTPEELARQQEELARQQEALAAQAARQQQELAAQAALQQEQLRRQQLQEQMGQYRYIGYVNQSGVQKAFLGRGREIYIIRQGDTLEGKFQVALIEATTVKLVDTDSKLETILKLKKDELPATGT